MITVKNIRHIIISALTIAIFSGAQAHAQCVSPAGVEGEIIMNGDYNVPAFCDGTDWNAMVGGEPSGSGASTIVVPSGLIGYWPLDGDAVDAIGSNDGSLVGGAAFTALQVNDGITLDGSGDRINLGSDSSIDNIAGEMSICLWASKDSGGGYQTLLGKSTDGYNGWDFYWAGGNGFGFLTPKNGYRERSSGVSQATLHHLCGTWDGTDGSSGIILYLDGAVYTGTGGGDLGADINDAANDLLIGGGGGGDFPGDIDDVRLYNRVISPTEITEIYNCGVAGDCGSAGSVDLSTQIVPSGLVGHWRLDETDNATTGIDSSGNGNDGTYQDFSGLDLVWEIPMAIKNGVEFGNRSSLDIPADPTIDNLNQFTVSGWAIATPAGGNATLFHKENEYSIFLQQPGEINIRMDRWVDNGEWRNEDEYDVTAGQLYHFAVTYDASSDTNDPILYINGEPAVLDNFDSPSGALQTVTPGKFVIGNQEYTGTSNEWSEPIDDVRLYNRVLTPEEIIEIFNARDGIRYNASHRTMEYFDGNQHVSMTPNWAEPAATASIYDCASIGDVCADGTVYAGISTDNGAKMYVSASNDANTIAWSSESVSHGSNINDADDGDGNQAWAEANLVLANYPALETCANSSVGGYNDWYLPAHNENQILYNNKDAIGGFTLNGRYWSSSEVSATNAFFWNHLTGFAGSQAKTDSANFQVRCVRKGNPAITGTGSLIGHWRLDETSGTTAVDSSGNGNNGTLSSGVTPGINGAVSNAAKFDNTSNAYITIANESFFDFQRTDAFSLSAWIYRNNNFSEDDIIEKVDTSADYRGYAIWLHDSDNELEFDITSHGATNVIAIETTGNAVPTGEWAHVVATYNGSSDASGAAIYVNGIAQSTNTIRNTLSASIQNNEPLLIGTDGPGGGCCEFNGMIDDVRIYSRALSSTEIAQLYNMGTPVGSITALPQGCPNIGDVCDDGTIYAGLSPDGSVEMFTTATDQGSLEWNDGVQGNWTSTSATSSTAGEANTATIVISDSNTDANFQPHNAAQACYDLAASGADDWYLPAADELNILYTNRTAIGNFELAGGEYGPPAASWYWSSTEQNIGDVILQRFEDGTTAGWNKHYDKSVRCVRKGPAPRCANPYGVEGAMLYNTDNDVVQYCDGARWVAIGKYQ